MLTSPPGLALRLSRIRSGQVLIVLNFHRVDDQHISAYGAVRPRQFDDLLRWLKQHFHIVTFGDLTSGTPRDRPLLVLSFDDGYRDFVETAAPIAEKHRVRVNQNIIPHCVETGLPPLNVLLQDFIGQAPASLLREVAIPGLPEGADPDRRARSGLVASAHLKRFALHEQKKIMATLIKQFERLDGFRPAPMMTAAEVAEVSRHHELGSHSFEHASMEHETDAYLLDDAAKCKEWHRKTTGVLPSVYAFPNGSARPGQAELVLKSGFQTVLLVGETFSSLDAKVHNRFTMYGESLDELKYRATGNSAAVRRA